MNNLDGMYYRNRDIIASQSKCSKYKFIRNYSACSEDEVKKTKEPTSTDFVAPPKPPAAKPAAPKTA